MSEPDNFFSRWSQRKRAAAESKAESDQVPVTRTVADAGDGSASAAMHTQNDRSPPNKVQADVPAPAEAEFDLSSLPSLESIGPDTDVRAFLKPGVPATLRNAALRRAWATDPAILNFKGLAENDWDFNDPDAVPGFGRLEPDFDVRKMAARLLGDDDPPATPSAEKRLPETDELQAQASQQSDSDAHASTTAERAASAPTEVSSDSDSTKEKTLVQREEDTASQRDESVNSTERNKSRRHGGALPREVPKY